MNIDNKNGFELFDYSELDVQSTLKNITPIEQKSDSIVEKLKKVAVSKIQPEESGSYAPVSLDPDKISYIKFDYLTGELGLSKELVELSIKADGNIDKIVTAQRLLEKQQFQGALIEKTMAVATAYKDVNFLIAIADLAPTFTAENLTRLLDSPGLKDSKLRKTLIKGSQIVKDRLIKNISDPQYVKKNSSQDEYSFVVDSKNIMHVKGAIEGKGASKKISTSLSLQEGEENVIGKIRNFSKLDLEKELKNEQTILELGHSKKGIAPSYKLTIMLTNNSPIVSSHQALYLQKKMSGSGLQLFSASSKEQINFMGDILEGLTLLHEHDYVHSDVKFENFLRDKDGHGYLTDFGTTVKEGDQLIGLTPMYSPPEHTNESSKAMDLFAAGLCLLNLSNPEQFIGELIIKDGKNTFHSNKSPVHLREPLLRLLETRDEYNNKKLEDLDDGEVSRLVSLCRNKSLKDLSDIQLEDLMKECQANILNINDEAEREDKLKMFLVAGLLLKRQPEERIPIKEASALLQKSSAEIRHYASQKNNVVNMEEQILDEGNELELLISKHDVEKGKKKLSLAEKLRRMWESIAS